MEFIYSLFENYGLWVLLLVAFLSQLGIPLGSTFFLMWYGSTIDSSSSLFLAIPATALAAILGDITAYSLGRRFSNQFDNAEKRYSWLAKKVKQSNKLLNAYGVWIIWITRFMATGLGPFVNYLLGSRKYSLRVFSQWVIFGELIFSAEMIYFGYHFKDTWEDLLAVIADAGWLIVLILISLWIIKRLLKKSKH
jgi:membrane protein DedA with SNARE-associated domain